MIIIIGISDNLRGNNEDCKENFRSKICCRERGKRLTEENYISLFFNLFVQPIFHNCRSGKDKLIFFLELFPLGWKT